MASVKFNVSVPADQIKRLESLLSPQQVKQALFQAVKRTAGNVKAMVVDELRENSDINQKYAGRSMQTILPKGDSPEAWLVVSAKPVPAIGFKYRASEKSGVQASFNTDLGMAVKHGFKATMPNADPDSDDAGHTGLFVRKFRSQLSPRQTLANQATSNSAHTTAGMDVGMMMAMQKGQLKLRGPAGGQTLLVGRLPIRELYGPSAAQLIRDKEELERKIQGNIDGMMQKNLDSQVDRFLKEAK